MSRQSSVTGLSISEFNSIPSVKMDDSLGFPLSGCKWSEYRFCLCILCICTAGTWKQKQPLAMSSEDKLVELGAFSDFLFVMEDIVMIQN